MSRYSVEPDTQQNQDVGHADVIFVVAIRHEGFRRVALDQISMAMWHEPQYQLAWSALESLVQRAIPVNRGTMRAAVLDLDVDPNLKRATASLVDEVFSLDDSVVEDLRPYAADTLWRFVAERSIIPELRSVASLGTPDDLDMHLESIYRRVQRLRGGLGQQGLSLDLDRPGYLSGDFRSTGIPFLDEFMGGGYSAQGELHGLLGPTGAGKTTLGVQILAHAVMYSVPRGLWFYVSYETGFDELQCRLLSCAARVSRDTLARWEGLAKAEEQGILSRKGKLKDYERRLFRYASGDEAPGELERLRDAYKRLFPYVRVLPGYRHGSLLHRPAVLKSAIERTCMEADLPVGGIVVDYVGVAALKLQDEDRIAQALRIYIGRFQEALHAMADEYSCPVWLLHQIAGSGLSYKPARPLTHDLAQESKSFANPLTFCFCLGNPDPDTQCILLNCSKSRRARRRPPVVLRMHEEIAMFERTDAYVPNPFTGGIVHRDEL